MEGIDKEGGAAQSLARLIQPPMPTHSRSQDDEGSTLNDDKPRMNHPRNTIAHRRARIGLHRHQHHSQRTYHISPLPKHICKILLHDGEVSSQAKKQPRCRKGTAHPRHPDVEGIDSHQHENEKEAQLPDEPVEYGRQNNHHDEVSHIPERQEYRSAVVGSYTKPSSSLIPDATVPEHVEASILYEIIADTVPWLAVKQDATYLESQRPEHDEHVPSQVWDNETMPSLPHLADIYLLAILLHLQEEEVARNDEKDGHSAPRYHDGAKQPNVIVYGCTR